MPGLFGTAPSMAPRLEQTGRSWPFRNVIPAMETWLEAERDQLPLWLPVAIGGGITVWLLLPGGGAWAGFLSFSMAAACLCAMMPAGGRLPRAGLWLALALALGCGIAWLRAEQVRAPILARPQVARLTGRIETIEPQPARGLTRFTLATDAGSGLPPRIRVNAKQETLPQNLAIGARVAVRARLMPPAPSRQAS